MSSICRQTVISTGRGIRFAPTKIAFLVLKTRRLVTRSLLSNFELVYLANPGQLLRIENTTEVTYMLPEPRDENFFCLFFPEPCQSLKQ